MPGRIVLAILVAAAVAGAVTVIIYELEKISQDDLRRMARWTARSYTRDDHTVVSASYIVPSTGQSLEEVVVDRIASSDPAHDMRLNVAMFEAMTRAQQLHAGASLEHIRREVSQRLHRHHQPPA